MAAPEPEVEGQRAGDHPNGSGDRGIDSELPAADGGPARGTDYRLKKDSTEITANSVAIDAGQSHADVTLEVTDD